MLNRPWLGEIRYRGSTEMVAYRCRCGRSVPCRLAISPTRRPVPFETKFATVSRSIHRRSPLLAHGRPHLAGLVRVRFLGYRGHRPAREASDVFAGAPTHPPSVQSPCAHTSYDARSVARDMLARLERNRHLDLLIELAEDRNHAVESEAAKLCVAHARELRVRDAGHLFRVRRRALAFAE